MAFDYNLVRLLNNLRINLRILKDTHDSIDDETYHIFDHNPIFDEGRTKPDQWESQELFDLQRKQHLDRQMLRLRESLQEAIHILESLGTEHVRFRPRTELPPSVEKDNQT